MNKMTCRPRLRQRLRRGENGFVFVAAICLGLMVTSARGGSLDAPAGPTSPASAMWTLNDIYNKLDTRAAVSKRTGAFTEPSGGPTSGTMHTLNDIMTLVTNRAPVPKTGQKTTYAPYYDDGWYGTNVGVAWPTQRFTAVAESGDKTNQIRDNLTGLIWARNASNACGLAVATTNWATAIQSCANLDYGGTNDWRLPNIHELFSLVDNSQAGPALPAGHPFIDVLRTGYYWSSTTYMGTVTSAWRLYLFYGDVNFDDKSSVRSVWPVRGGQ